MGGAQNNIGAQRSLRNDSVVYVPSNEQLGGTGSGGLAQGAYGMQQIHGGLVMPNHLMQNTVYPGAQVVGGGGGGGGSNGGY